MVAQQAAISSFPLGAGFGSLWYGLFPVVPSTALLFSFSGWLLAIGSVLSAFAGIVADPVQRRLGLHQRRLRRMIDAMERQMLDPAAPGYAVRDCYVGRLLDVFDLVTRHIGSRVERFPAHPNSRRGTEAISRTIPDRLNKTRMSRRNPASLNRA